MPLVEPSRAKAGWNYTGTRGPRWNGEIGPKSDGVQTFQLPLSYLSSTFQLANRWRGTPVALAACFGSSHYGTAGADRFRRLGCATLPRAHGLEQITGISAQSG